MRTQINSIIILSFVFLSCLMTSCDKEVKIEPSVSSETKNSDSTKITAKDIAKIKYTDYALSDLTQSKTADWQKFIELSNQIEILKTGDLSFFRDDKAILEGFLSDLFNEAPESLKAPAVLVRLTVIKTVFFKLEGLASLSSAKKEDLLLAITDVLISHSNLVFQINKKFEKESQNIEKPN